MYFKPCTINILPYKTIGKKFIYEEMNVTILEGGYANCNLKYPGAIAPTAEQLICTQKVAGANPAGSILDKMNENSHIDSDINNINSIVEPALTGLVVAGFINNNDTTLNFISHRQTTLELATYLKLSSIFKMNSPIDCHVVDRIEDKFRFTIIYNMQSFNGNTRLQLVTKTNDVLPLVSLQSIFPAYNWAEREVWDMSGIFFIKHPDLRRILTDYGFAGHPLRKDFPLSGFREVHYEDSTKHIEYDALELSQNYRVSNLLNPWSNEKKV